MTDNIVEETATTAVDDEKPEEIDGSTKEDVVESSISKKLKETEGTFAVFESKCVDAFNVLEESYKELQNEMKRLESAKKKLDDVHFLDVVTLNVGGKKFQTGLQTLTKYPGSLFTTMFSSTHELKKDQDGSYFIDRDGTLFRYVINYMRTGEKSPRMKELAYELIVEAKFFGLPGLIDALSQNDGEEIDDEETDDEEYEEEETRDEEDDDGSLISGNQSSEEVTTVDIAKRVSKVKELFTEAKRSLTRAKVASNDNFLLLEEKQRNFLEMAKRLKDVHFSEIVTLNVGGKIYQTSVSTLQKDPNSMLAAMFSGRFEVVKQKDGAYFIDRDGTHFRHILNFLRIGRIARGVVKEVREELAEEAEFYNLQPLVEAIAKLTQVRVKNDGEVLATTMSALRRHGFEDSFFSLVQKVPQIDDTFVISQPLPHLADVFQFLENGKLSKEQHQKIKVDLYNTAVDLDFKYLQNYLTDFGGSKILDGHREYIEILKEWLKEKSDPLLPCLIYSAEEQGWEHTNFAKHCFGKGPTLVLIESEFGCIFGGYTSIDWLSASDDYQEDGECFLFSLKSLEWDKPFMMPANENSGIFCDDSSLPCFGNVDAVMSQLEMEDQPNKNKSYYNEYSAFNLPEGVPQNLSFLAGNRSFLTTKLEIFAI